MVPNKFIRKSTIAFRLGILSAVLANFRFWPIFGGKTGSWGRNHMVPNIFIRKSTIAFRLGILSAVLANFRFWPVFGGKTGSWGRSHMVPNIFIRKSTIAFRLSILSSFSVNFRFSTGFSPIKPEVGTLRVWDLDQTWVSRVFRVEWGVNHFCRTTSGFYRKWLIGPEIRLHQVKDHTRYVGHTFFCLAPRPLLPLQNWVFKVPEVITGSGSRNRKKCAGQIEDQPLISNFQKMSTPLSLTWVVEK